MNLKLAFAATALAFHASAFPQTQPAVGVSPALEVQRLAPQLLQFLGSQTNFQSLVSGLSQGSAVTLISATADGFTQIVSFTPAGGLTAVQIAQTLEAARQQLISRGIATPSAEQVGVTLMGGTLPTALGPVAVNGVVANPAAAASSAAGSTSTTLPRVVNSLVIQIVPTPTAAGAVSTPNTSSTPVTRNTSDSPLIRNTSDSSPAATPSTTTPGATTPAPAAATAPLATPAAPGVQPRFGAAPR
jgi:hypothetical protein